MSDQTIRIGQELVRRRLATLEQVRECLATQDDLRTSGRDVTIGHLLVARGVLGLEDLKEVLSELKLLVLYCPSCRTELTIVDYNRGNQYMCEECSAELIFASTRPPEPDPVPAATSSSQKRDRDDRLIGEVVGGCKIRRKIASGGMGTVYEAEQVNLSRTVALKVLADDLAGDDVFVRRFLLEARSAAELNHINIIHINDAGQENGVFFYTMEYIEGENLNQRLRRTRIVPIEDALDIAAQVSDALDHAHQRDIIHRDIKPENIMLTPQGRVKLADLGLAKKVMDTHGTTLTQAGSILGTPYYMAPEQARDFAAADNRSDLYSLGVTLYKMLSGRVPYEGKSPIEVMVKALDGNKAPLGTLVSGLPVGVSDLVDRLMHLEPEQRFQSAGDVRDACREQLRQLDKHELA